MFPWNKDESGNARQNDAGRRTDSDHRAPASRRDDRRDVASGGRRAPLPPISSSMDAADLRQRDEPPHRDGRNGDSQERKGWSMSGAPHDGAYKTLDVLQGRVAQAEHSAKSLMQEALRIQGDIDENYHRQHSAWRDERRHRQLLREHIASITHVCKVLSRELDASETRLGQQLAMLAQRQQQMAMEFQTNAGRLGWSQSQQEYVNAQVRSAVQTLVGGQKTMQATLVEEMRILRSRLDAVEAKAQTEETLRETTSGRTAVEVGDVLLRVRGLDGRLQQLEDKVSAIHERLVVHDQTSTQLASSVSDLDLRMKNVADTAAQNLLSERNYSQQARNDLQRELADALSRQVAELNEAMQAKQASTRQLVQEAMKTWEARLRQTQQQLQEDVESATARLSDSFRRSTSDLQMGFNQQTAQLQNDVEELAQAMQVMSDLADKRAEAVQQQLRRVNKALVLPNS